MWYDLWHEIYIKKRVLISSQGYTSLKGFNSAYFMNYEGRGLMSHGYYDLFKFLIEIIFWRKLCTMNCYTKLSEPILGEIFSRRKNIKSHHPCYAIFLILSVNFDELKLTYCPFWLEKKMKYLTFKPYFLYGLLILGSPLHWKEP